MSQPAPDFATITGKQQATWALGDFHVIAKQVMAASEALVRAAGPRPGQRVLDVACGSGNAALIAERNYCQVTGIDYVPALIERAKQRAVAEAAAIDFRVADAQALPFPDASFDVVLSVFGVMFAPDQERAAAELLRVTRPGGRIALACWMPEGFGGELFRAHAQFVPPPPGLKPAVRWGTEAGLKELLGTGTREIRSQRRTVIQHYRSIDHLVAEMRRFFGPTNRAFDVVGPTREAEVATALGTVFSQYNRAKDGTAELHCEYLETVATRT
jgi:SAM-dependent methyltransferase